MLVSYIHFLADLCKNSVGFPSKNTFCVFYVLSLEFSKNVSSNSSGDWRQIEIKT